MSDIAPKAIPIGNINEPPPDLPCNPINDEPIPTYLFRVFTIKTHGTNTPKYFKSALRTWHCIRTQQGITFDHVYGDLPKQLRKALYEDHENTENNPFIFTTVSLLYALQHAIKKEHEDKCSVFIICIDTQTARTSKGERVNFRSVDRLMQDLGMKPLSAKSRKVLDFSDVHLTSDDIIPGEGSRVTSLQALKDAGLFSLFPAYEKMCRHGCRGLEQGVSDLRQIRFDSPKVLTPEEISLAAKLASTFRDISGTSDACLRTELFSWFLAVTGLDIDTMSFARWLKRISRPQPASINLGSWVSDESSVAEVEIFVSVYEIIGMRYILTDEVEKLDSRVREMEKRIEVEAYDTLKNEQYKRKWGHGKGEGESWKKKPKLRR